jgi:hypothetical protein
MPTTPFLGVTEVAPNQSGKEVAINTAIRALESAQNAALAVDMAAGDVTLSVNQFTRNFIFKVTGLTAARTLRIPAQVNGVNANRIFAVRNSSNYPITVQVTGAPGTFVTIPGGGLETRLLDVDGAGNVAQVSLPPTANAMITIEDNTANHTLASTDVSNYLRMTSNAANTVTVPANAASSIGIGARILVAQAGLGFTTFVPAAGVTILSPSSFQLRTRYSLVWITKVGVDTWVLDGDLIGTAESRIVVNETTASRTLVQSDVNAFIRMDNAAANGVTLPPQADVPIAIGSRVMITQAGVGVTSIAAGTGVTVETPGNLTCRARYSTIIATKTATNTWVLSGDLGGIAGGGGGGISAINDQAANYQPVLADADALVRMTSGSANTFTLPADATVNFPLRTSIGISQNGAGQTTFAAGAGAIIQVRGNALKMAGQHGVATAIKVAANTWLLTGDLTA